MAVIITGDGSHSVFSEQYGVTYHSRYGAVTESAHVFIAMGLRYQAGQKKKLEILEAGLGTALNAFMTWLEAERSEWAISYTALEAYPLPGEVAAEFNYAEMLQAPERHSDFLKLHETDWDTPVTLSDHFIFEKKKLNIENFSSEPRFDVVYFDAFAPQAQPELWTAEVFSQLYSAMVPGGVLVTYCAQGAFKRVLKDTGFQVERLPGPPGKREMTRATKPV